MLKDEAVEMIDRHKNGLKDPADMLHWTWLRVIIANLTQAEWEAALERALPVLAAG
jgi:hypothetical protein